MDPIDWRLAVSKTKKEQTIISGFPFSCGRASSASQSGQVQFVTYPEEDLSGARFRYTFRDLCASWNVVARAYQRRSDTMRTQLGLLGQCFTVRRSLR